MCYFQIKEKIVKSDSLVISLALVPLGRIFFPIVHDRDKFSNREQSETNRYDENAMCDHLSEYLRMCFRLYKEFSRPFLNILRTFENEAR